MADGTYVLFVWKPSGYELHERQGELPEIGQEIELDGGEKPLRVFKVGASPLPGDERPCIFLQA